MRFLRPFKGFIRMLHRLLRVFLSGLVIFFPVVHGRSAMFVSGKFVKLGSSLMRIVWHVVFPSNWPL